MSQEIEDGFSEAINTKSTIEDGGPALLACAQTNNARHSLDGKMQMVRLPISSKTRKDLAVRKALQVPANANHIKSTRQKRSKLRRARVVSFFWIKLPHMPSNHELDGEKRSGYSCHNSARQIRETQDSLQVVQHSACGNANGHVLRIEKRTQILSEVQRAASGIDVLVKLFSRAKHPYLLQAVFR
jgi:hypothetical protein